MQNNFLHYSIWNSWDIRTSSIHLALRELIGELKCALKTVLWSWSRGVGVGRNLVQLESESVSVKLSRLRHNFSDHINPQIPTFLNIEHTLFLPREWEIISVLLSRQNDETKRKQMPPPPATECVMPGFKCKKHSYYQRGNTCNSIYFNKWCNLELHLPPHFLPFPPLFLPFSSLPLCHVANN